MRRLAIALIAAAWTAAAPTPAPAAKPRLDRSFGAHHGYWTRTDGVWANPASLSAVSGGTAIVPGGGGRFARIGADGRPDRAWGKDGILDLTGRFGVADAAVRWNGRYVVLASAYATSTVRRVVRVVDARGRTLSRPTAAIQAVLPVTPVPPVTAFGSELLVPDANGRLWDLRTEFRRPSGSAAVERQVLSVFGPAGVPLRRDRTDLKALPGDLDLDKASVASRQGIIVTVVARTGTSTLRRLRRDGSLDPAFRPVRLSRYTVVEQMLPWRGGAVVLDDAGTVRWISATGRLVRRRSFPIGSRVTFDAARRLVVLSHGADLESVVVRRLRRDGTADAAFGRLRLRAAGRTVEGVGVLAGPGGRLLVVARSLVFDGGFREDFAPHGTVVWRIRTR